MSCEYPVMSYSTLSETKNGALKEPIFFGQLVNITRHDQQKYEVFERLIGKQLLFFRRPEEIDVPRDRVDYANLPEHEKHIFISDLRYQTLLDSIQGRSPNVALLPLVSIPELETWIETRSFGETIHSRSYTYIIRNIANDPSVAFDDIVQNEHIIARAEDIAYYYDDPIEYIQYYNLLGRGVHNAGSKLVTVSLCELKKRLYLCLICVSVLEAIRFYVLFAHSFAFAERELIGGNAKIIKLTAHDEALYLTSTQYMLNLTCAGADDPEMVEIAVELQGECSKLSKKAAEQEKEWVAYLFKDGLMIGLSRKTLAQYVEYVANLRMQVVDLPVGSKDVTQNPILWINAWLSPDNVWVAPQEVEIPSYLIDQIDSEVSVDDSGDFELQSGLMAFLWFHGL